MSDRSPPVYRALIEVDIPARSIERAATVAHTVRSEARVEAGRGVDDKFGHPTATVRSVELLEGWGEPDDE